MNHLNEVLQQVNRLIWGGLALTHRHNILTTRIYHSANSAAGVLIALPAQNTCLYKI